MRRSLVVLGLVAVFVIAAAPAGAFDFNVSAGMDFAGDFDNFDFGTETGYSLGIEVCFDIPIVEVGVGLEYGFPRDTDLGNVDIDYTYLYAVGRLGFIGPLYFAARVGYSDISVSGLIGDEADGGETWSVGIGAEFFDKLKVEALLNNFSGELSGVHSNFDYQTYSLKVLYTF